MDEHQGPICISVINMKGGVGKTTIAALLSRYATQNLNLKVVAVDLDPQANLSQALMGGPAYKSFLDEKEPSIVEVFNGYRPPRENEASPQILDVGSVARPTIPNLRVIPSRLDFSNNLSNAITDTRVLAWCIANNFQDCDLVIIDCAPTESAFTEVAYHASRYILVPVRPEFLATIGFPLLNDSLNAFRNKNKGHQIDVIGVVVNDSNYQTGPEERMSLTEIRSESQQNNWPIFEHKLYYSKGFPKIMRGNYKRLGDANWVFEQFAAEFFATPELSDLQNRRPQGGSTP